MSPHDLPETETSDSALPEAPPRRRTAYGRRAFWGALCAFAAITLLLTLTGRIDSLAQNLLARLGEPPAQNVPVVAASTEAPGEDALALRDFDIHPDRLYRPYTAGPVLSDSPATSPRLIDQFRDLLDLYTQRQGVDDNFTLRVVDNRTNELLELRVLEEEKARYEREGATDWAYVDGLRREETRRLVREYVARGVPKEAITVKWGRADQIRESQRRDRPFTEYETRLARYLGLSLLATEVGTVETFNQDRLVSAVGARSRYQIMPYLLRQLGVHHYDLRTGTGARVRVFEEWHPLLVMEPAFVTMRAYTNIVGHEIPGISAYHTGPGNIFKVYQLFLTRGPELFSPSSTVMDAYMWAVTEGFDEVSSRSSFGQYSRGYVASAYGALRASADVRIDTAQTVRAERVRLEAGASIYLSELLRALGEPGAAGLRWWTPSADSSGADVRIPSLYNRFRLLNPHIVLPEPALDVEGAPAGGDVRLTATAQGVPVRFFLPLGALDYLAARGIDLFDEEATFAFDRTTYADVRARVTLWDRHYDALVDDIGRFGFTEANRRRLGKLKELFERLAKADPSHYRQTQLRIITIHERMWGSAPWQTLASATAAALGESRAPVRPPDRLALPPPSTLGPRR